MWSGPSFCRIGHIQYRRPIRLYFGPTSPKGSEKNWIQTVPGKAWFVGFRFYAPTKAYFDKSCRLPDMEKVK